jgi:hypothetical protein
LRKSPEVEVPELDPPDPEEASPATLTVKVTAACKDEITPAANKTHKNFRLIVGRIQLLLGVFNCKQKKNYFNPISQSSIKIV